MTTVVYTDGACLGNPGPGGWAWAVPGGRFASGPAALTTNQRMEIQAVLEAARALPGPLEVVSDSTYVVNCFRDRWWESWLAKGWINSQRKPVANRDLWEPLIALHRADPARIRFRWVKGHSGDVMNDLVDRLAVEAATAQQGRAGDGPPAGLGPPDTPSGRATRRQADAPGGRDGGGDLPEGRRLLVVGPRPPGLGGYDANPVADGVRARLAEIISAKRELHPDLVVLTGLSLGAEQLAAEAAASVGVPYVAVLPYPDQEAVWPVTSQARYRQLLDGAADSVLLQGKLPESRPAAGGALARRDAWLRTRADEAVAVWDGQDPALGKTVRSLRDALGEEDVWVLDVPAPDSR